MIFLKIWGYTAIGLWSLITILTLGMLFITVCMNIYYWLNDIECKAEFSIELEDDGIFAMLITVLLWPFAVAICVIYGFFYGLRYLIRRRKENAKSSKANNGDQTEQQ